MKYFVIATLLAVTHGLDGDECTSNNDCSDKGPGTKCLRPDYKSK